MVRYTVSFGLVQPPTVLVLIYGGPFDGDRQHWPVTEPLTWQLAIAPNHDPSVRAVYWLHSIGLGAHRYARYVYGVTVPVPAA